MPENVSIPLRRQIGRRQPYIYHQQRVRTVGEQLPQSHPVVTSDRNKSIHDCSELLRLLHHRQVGKRLLRAHPIATPDWKQSIHDCYICPTVEK